MKFSTRISLIICAVVMLIMATVLVINSGLPDRSEFTGQFVAGEYVAPEVDSLAPPIQGNSISDTIINTYQLRGTTVIVNFWATWCGPCRVEMPILQDIYDEFTDELTIIAINLGEPRSIVQHWVQEQGLTYEILIDNERQIETLYNLLAPPSTYIVNAEGVITDIFYGPVTANSLRQSLSQIILDNF